MLPRAQVLRPGYLIAFFLVVAPFTDLYLRARPVQLGEASWRYGVVGFLSLSMEAVFLGVLLTAFLAAALGHGRVLRGVAIFSAVLAVALLGAAGIFVLDALQMRAIVNPAIRPSFDMSALVALSKLAAGAVVASMFTWAAAAELRAGTVGRSVETHPSSLLVATSGAEGRSRRGSPAI